MSFITVHYVCIFMECACVSHRFPHPVTLAGTLEMGTAYLPVNQNWVRYIQTAEDKFESLQKDVKQILMNKADEALKLLQDEKYVAKFIEISN